MNGGDTQGPALLDGDGLARPDADTALLGCGMKGLRVLMLGASYGGPCGVRDYAQVLQESLGRRDVSVTTLWWEREEAWTLARTWRDLQSWLDHFERAVRENQFHAIVFHYSVFTWAHRGVPVFGPPLARRLGRCTTPAVVMLHELAYPFHLGDWRGNTWAVVQRAGLVPLLRWCDGALVTTDDRARWVSERRWLSTRPIAVVPVFSNVPPPDTGRRPGDGSFSIGIFGYGSAAFDPQPVMHALARLAARDGGVRLVLVGAPGEQSPEGRRWRAAAAGVGCASSVHFTGVLEPRRLSAALAGIDIVLFPDIAGPTSRKTTLAAALAYGKPVVALEGPQRWEDLVRAGGVVIARDGEDMAAAIEALRGDPLLRRRQGERGAAFYLQRMAPDVIAARVTAFLEGITAEVAPSVETDG
jgi:glycosyltransferase involved in cell wall biosynthesis